MVAILLIPLLLVGNNDRVVTSEGKTIARIQKDSSGINVYDNKGQRLGYGREGYGGTEYYFPNGDRWFTVRPDSSGNSTIIVAPKDHGSGGGRHR